MPLVWSVGTILGPCIGGTFADPHETWPDVFPRGSLLDRFPYLLPNLICAGLLLVSIVLGVFLLEETHHDMGPRTLLEADGFISEQTPLRETSDAIKRPVVDARSPAYGTFVNQHPGAGDATEKSQKSVAYSIFSNRRIMAIVISLSIYVSDLEPLANGCLDRLADRPAATDVPPAIAKLPKFLRILRRVDAAGLGRTTLGQLQLVCTGC